MIGRHRAHACSLQLWPCLMCVIAFSVHDPAAAALRYVGLEVMLPASNSGMSSCCTSLYCVCQQLETLLLA